jgi:hypothetical protein
MTVARDIEDARDLADILRQAEILGEYARYVVLVPKDPLLVHMLESIPHHYVLGYSVPTHYGGTALPPAAFGHRVHLLGGRPDVQRRLADQMPVVSVDCNRFTLDAAYGDYFDGECFRPHPIGGYERCLHDSIANIDGLWKDYKLAEALT